MATALSSAAANQLDVLARKRALHSVQQHSTHLRRDGRNGRARSAEMQQLVLEGKQGAGAPTHARIAASVIARGVTARDRAGFVTQPGTETYL